MKDVCAGCGWCCKWWVTYEWLPDAATKERWRVAGFQAYRVRLGKRWGVALFIPYRCPQLTGNNRCRLHGKNKPKICADFPLSGSKGFYLLGDSCVFTKTRKNCRALSTAKRVV